MRSSSPEEKSFLHSPRSERSFHKDAKRHESRSFLTMVLYIACAFILGVVIDSWARPVTDDQSSRLQPALKLTNQTFERPPPAPRWSSKFYIVNIPGQQELDRLASNMRFTNSHIFPYMIELLKSHPARTWNKEEADLYIMNFDVQASFNVNKSYPDIHVTRLRRISQFLLNDTILWKNDGSKLLWVISHWLMVGRMRQSKKFWPVEFKHLHRNAIVCHYIQNGMNNGGKHLGFLPSWVGIAGNRNVRPAYFDNTLEQGEIDTVHDNQWHRQLHDWAYTVVVPQVSAPGLLLNDQDLTPESWSRRKYLLHFRGRGGKACGNGGQEIRDVLHDSLNALKYMNSSIGIVNARGHATNYFAEIKESKFCFVVRCDDVETSRLYDALAAGCIPIILGWHHRLAASPFFRRINYDGFSIQLSERLFLADKIGTLHWVYNLFKKDLNLMLHNLKRERRKLLWLHPKSQAHDEVLIEAFDFLSYRGYAA